MKNANMLTIMIPIPTNDSNLDSIKEKYNIHILTIKYRMGTNGYPNTLYGLSSSGSLCLKTKRDITVRVVVMINEIPAYSNICSNEDDNINKIDNNS